MKRIDAHQHFWRLERGDYDWLTADLVPIYRDFLPEEIVPLLDTTGVEATIAVQAAPTVAETEYLLSLAAENDFIVGVVGWAGFEAPDAAEQIAALAANRALVGLRPMIQDIADADWMLRESLTPAFDALKAADLTFDALVKPWHLENLRRLLERHGDMRVVIDHGAKPQMRAGPLDDWAADMAALARDTDAFCKLSGLVTEAGADWTTEELRPVVDHLVDVFGPDRLIWGSDWPVCTLAATYGQWMNATQDLVADLSDAERDALFGGNAVRAYGLKL
jgi:L-fuconolactonase